MHELIATTMNAKLFIVGVIIQLASGKLNLSSRPMAWICMAPQSAIQ